MSHIIDEIFDNAWSDNEQNGQTNTHTFRQQVHDKRAMIVLIVPLSGAHLADITSDYDRLSDSLRHGGIVSVKL